MKVYDWKMERSAEGDEITVTIRMSHIRDAMRLMGNADKEFRRNGTLVLSLRSDEPAPNQVGMWPERRLSEVVA